MSKRYDAIAVRKYERNGEEKSAFTNIGIAFPLKDKPGFRVTLHAVPAPVNGEFTILLMEPKPRDDRRSAMQEAAGNGFAPAPRGSSSLSDELDDEIPF